MIISSISYKGGVGKTTVAQNLAVCFAHSGYKVCIVDADELQNSMKWVANRDEDLIQIPVFGQTDSGAIMKNVRSLYEDYEVIIIDSPPTVQKIASKIILLSHIMLIPITPTGGSEIWTMNDMLERFQNIQDQKEEKIHSFFLLNRFKPNVKMHQAYTEALQEYEEDYSIKLLKSKLHDRAGYGEANLQGMGAFEYSNTKAKQEVIDLTNEIIKISDVI